MPVSPESRGLPEVPGILTATQVAETGESIAEWQLPTGMIPWFPGGHADVWNHVEALMALDVCGRHHEVERAFDWLASTQRDDGAWHQYYLADRVEQEKLDANTIAYVATGVWHHWLLSKDRGFLETTWPMVERAVEFVLDLQTPRGEILWARHADGTPWSFALLTGSSSISHSLRCAVAIAEELGEECPDWELSLGRLVHTLRHEPDAFAPKHRWAMDWYYPVLTGVVRGDEGAAHLDERLDTFYLEDKGIRCVSDRPWITAAETCECLLAYLGVGRRDFALELFQQAQSLRSEEGYYWTGIVYPQRVHFPGDERSTYTAAAVVLAADALAGASPASDLFVDHDLLPAVALGEAHEDQPSLD
ncbi:MAG TPA: hypothetical protein VD926_11395 [Acidimicrobiales bacterium]|nr:hypothetical protein [Acidimicrobiales bacterium]